jgi:REP element-mobilizing transposase RayT
MKPGTYTQLYVQLIFATKFRESFLRKEQRTEIWQYMSGIINNKDHKSIIVNGMADHVHILIGLNPKMSISDLVRDIKRSSSRFINDQKWVPGNFRWQDGYGAFSYSRSQLSSVYDYIKNQENHHQKKSFREEYLNLLRENDVNFDRHFLFEFFD